MSKPLRSLRLDLVCGALVLGLFFKSTGLWGQEPPILPGTNATSADESTEPESPLPDAATLSKLVEDVVRQALQENYEDAKHWGKQIQRFDGFDTYRGRLIPKKKAINHGFWQRFRVTILDPDHQLHIELSQIEAAQQGGVQFLVTASARVHVVIDYVLWTFGVKGINGCIDTDATVQIRTLCRIKLDSRFVPGSFLPEVIVRPTVEAVQFKLLDLDLRQIGLVGGSAARELGDFYQSAVEELLQTQEKRLKLQIQKALSKQELKLGKGLP